jgi:small-conductance mechanosensitive channel
MKKEEIDKLITESLSKDEAEFYKNLEGEEGLLKSISGLFSGKLAWLTIVMIVVNMIVVIIAFYSGYHLFTSESTAEILHYGSTMFLALMFASMIKLWTWLQMQKNSILREMKRTEYQIAVLMEKISDKD